MHSFILIAKTQEKQQEHLAEFIKSHAISPFDVTTVSEEGSVGIEIVRKIQESIFLKPYKGTSKIVVVNNAEQLTTEAQNALLKLLEEPPSHTFIFLCSNREDVLLPTILSRCAVIKLSEEKGMRSTQSDEKLTQDLDVLLEGDVAEKLVLAETLAGDKEHLAQWFLAIMLFTRDLLLTTLDDTEKNLDYAHILTSLQEAQKTFTSTNVSPRTILEHTFLTL